MKDENVIEGPVSLDVLRKFCAANGWLSGILHLWMPATFQRAEDDQLRASLGEAYEHVNWSTVVCDKEVMLCIPRWKCPGGKEPPLDAPGSFPARWFWCFHQIRDQQEVIPASEAYVARVPADVRERLEAAGLEDLRWWQVLHVVFTQSGRGKPKVMREPPPNDVVPFSFKGGYGMAVVGK